MQFIKSVIILVGVMSLVSCGERSEAKISLKDSKISREQEGVIGLWKFGKNRWSTMNFLENGTVELENSDGEPSLANWKRIEGAVYKIRVENEVIGEYERIESSVTIPEAVNGRNWTIKPNSVQYDVWSDSASESERSLRVTVDGDRLYRDLELSSESYRRVK